jgi:hypothetical protein
MLSVWPVQSLAGVEPPPVDYQHHLGRPTTGCWRSTGNQYNVWLDIQHSIASTTSQPLTIVASFCEHLQRRSCLGSGQSVGCISCRVETQLEVPIMAAHAGVCLFVPYRS